MVQTCFICRRRTDEEPKRSFHKLPVDTELRQKWLDSIGIGKNTGKVAKSAVICDWHFEGDCIRYGLVRGRKFIKEGSVPTLNLNYQPTGMRTLTETQQPISNTSLASHQAHCSIAPPPPAYIFLSFVPNVVPNTAPHQLIQSTASTSLPTGNDSQLTSPPPQSVQLPLPSSPSPPELSPSPPVEQRFVLTDDCENNRPRTPVENIVCENNRPRTPLENIIPRKKLCWRNVELKDFTESSNEYGHALLDKLKIMLDNKTSEINNLKAQIRRLKPKVTHFKTLVQKLKKNTLLTASDAELLNTKITPMANVLFHQLTRKKRSSSYPVEFRTFATTVYSMSPKAYEYIRRVFPALPNGSSVRNWLSDINIEPGILKTSVDMLKAKCELGTPLFFNIAVSDLTVRDPVEKDLREAVLVMVVCLNENWKVPLAYGYIEDPTSDERARLITDCLKELHHIHVHIVSITIDGGPSSIKMAKQLGAKFSPTKDSLVSFPHPVTDEPIFLIFDARFAIKLIRNALGYMKTIFDDEGNAVEWEYLRLLVIYQYRYGLQNITKIRKHHLKPERQKTLMNSGVQLFSTNVCNALHFLRTNAELKEFSGTDPLEKFCLIINDIYDLLNSKQLVTKKRDISYINLNNYEEIVEKVTTYEKYIRSLRFDHIPVLNTNRRLGFYGLIMSMRSAVAIFQRHPFLSFLATHRLSLEHVHLVFSRSPVNDSTEQLNLIDLRPKNDTSRIPTIKQFQSAIKTFLINAGD